MTYYIYFPHVKKLYLTQDGLRTENREILTIEYIYMYIYVYIYQKINTYQEKVEQCLKKVKHKIILQIIFLALSLFSFWDLYNVNAILPDVVPEVL